MQRTRGISLVEYLIYIGIFALLTLVVISFVVESIITTRRASAFREIQDNARIIREVLSQEIIQSLSVYTPTSVFDTSPGQLGLETKNVIPSNEASTYVDFYLDASGIYQKREGSNPIRITSQTVQVTNFILRHITQASLSAIRIEFSLNSQALLANPIAFTFTVSLRPNT